MHEHSVIAALAELERLEQDRIGDERRRAAEQKLRAIERDVERRFDERLERECDALRARLAGAHAAREALLEQRIDELRADLTAANAARDTLREALATLATPQPDAQPRGARVPLRGVVFAVMALAMLAAVYGARVLGAQHAAAPVVAAAPVAEASRPLEPAAPRGTRIAPAPQAEPRPQPSAAQSPPPIRPRPLVRHAGAAPRPHVTTPGPADPLGPLDGCGDDPTCGL